jgi:hypothetical protein
MGERCGIWTYASRVIKYLNGVEGVEAKPFISRCLDFEPDIINIQYEPGMLKQNDLNGLLTSHTQPAVVTAHHTLNLSPFYPTIDGTILHDDSQIVGEKPWDYKVIPHPALVFPKKDKKKLRKEFGLPQDKKIIGTMGFICGTHKILPLSVEKLLKKMNDDEFLYLITSFWKGGDMGRHKQVMDVVKKLGKEDNFRIDTDFIVDEDVLNSKMQACDLLYAWNGMPKNAPGSQSGSAADMYGARVKLVVKDVPHYAFIGKQDKVVFGREDIGDFVDDVLKTLREADLEDVQDPTWLSWEEQIKNYVDYMEELL